MKLLSRESSKSILVAFCVSLGVILVVASAFGSYYEEYQALFNAMLSGKLSPGVPFESWYYQGYIGLAYLYSKLYSYFPQVEWLSWLTYGYIAISGMLLMFLFGKVASKHLPKSFVVAFQFLFGLLILSDHIINLVNARMVFLICGSSMLAIIILFSRKNQIARHPIAFIALHIFFLVGCLSRSEPALAVGLLLSCFAVVWNRNLLKGWFIAFPSLLICVAIVAGILIDIKNSDSFHKQVEPDIEMQFGMRNNVVPISTMANARDSLRYEAAMGMIWGDPEVISVGFLRGLIAEHSYSTWNVSQWNRTISLLQEFGNKYLYLVLFNVILTLLLVVRAAVQRDIVFALLTLLYSIGFVIAVGCQTYFVKMTTWSFSPFLSVYTASMILLFLKEGGLSNNVGRIFASVLLVFGLIGHFNFIKKATDKLGYERESRQNMVTQLERTAAGEILLITPSSFQHFLSKSFPLHVFDFSDFKKVYFYESQVASLLPGYRDYLEKECSCDVSHFPNFYNYLMKNRNGNPVYCLTTPSRAELVSRYLWGIHGYNLVHCQLPDAQFKIDGRNGQTIDLALYELEVDTCMRLAANNSSSIYSY